MNVIINGAMGRMGRILADKVRDSDDLDIAALVDKNGTGDIYSSIDEVTEDADIVIDFSNHSNTEALLCFCQKNKLPVVIATTGQTDEEMSMIVEAASEIPVFKSANMSLGIALLCKLVREAAAAFPGSDVEIVETHHNRKLDAPSGTALLLGDSVKMSRPELRDQVGRAGHCPRQGDEIGYHAIRMGNITGTHEVMFGTDTQTITLRHEAHDRGLFADGALDAARFMVAQAPGFYNMDDLV